MTGSDTRFSALSDGQMDQFKRKLAAAGLNADHTRDFMTHPHVLEQWVKAGITAIDKLWSERFSFTPTREWQKIGNSRIVPDREIWVRSAEIPYNSNGDLMVEMSDYAPEDDDERQQPVYFIHRGFWATYEGGVQMRRTGPANEIEVRFPTEAKEASQLKSDEWEPEWSATLARGVLVSLGSGLNATVASRSHACIMCDGKALLALELVWCSDGREERVCIHLFNEEWYLLTPTMQIRAAADTTTIKVRERKH